MAVQKFSYVTSVEKNKKSESPTGIEPKTFRSDALAYWETETCGELDHL